MASLLGIPPGNPAAVRYAGLDKRHRDGFSKKIANHETAIALHRAYHNLVRMHESVRGTPAMALGVTD